MKSEKLSEMLKDLDEDLLEETDRSRSEGMNRKTGAKRAWIYALAAILVIGFAGLMIAEKPWKKGAAAQTGTSEEKTEITEEKTETADKQSEITEVFESSTGEAASQDTEPSPEEDPEEIQKKQEILRQAAKELTEHPEAVSVCLKLNDTGEELTHQLLYYPDGTLRSAESSAAFTWEFYAELLTGQRNASVKILTDAEMDETDKRPDTSSEGEYRGQTLIFHQGDRSFFLIEESDVVDLFGPGADDQVVYDCTPDAEWFTREKPLFYWLRKLFDMLEYEDACHETGHTLWREDYEIRIEDRGQSLEEIVREFNETWIRKTAEDDRKLSPDSRYQDAYKELFLMLPDKKLVNDQGACAVYAVLIFQPYNTASAENHGIIPEDELAYAYKKVYDGRFDDVRLGGEIPDGDFPTFYQVSETFLLKQDGYYELYFGDMGTDDPWRDLGFHETE